MNVSWTDEQVAKLRELVAQNQSFRKIAKTMELSRNAVIGKANRLGLFVPQQVTRPVEKRVQIRPRRNTSRCREVAVIEATEIIDIAPDQSPFACRIDGLEHDSCRWPLDPEPSADMRYCGAVKGNGTSYCMRHQRIAWKPGAWR